MLTSNLTPPIQHVYTLADQIGPRYAGSPAHQQAADTITRAFRAAGLHIERLPFACPGWTCTHTHLELGGDALRAAANIVSPACDVTAPTAAVETIAELDAANLTGKIAVLYGDLTRQPLIPLNCPIYNDPRDQHINRTLLNQQPAAVITVNPHVNNFERRIEDTDFTIPSATVPAEVGAHLLHHVGESARLVIDAECVPTSSAHLLGLKPGPRAACIALMAHFDTKLDTPGAWDNASGMAALLALADRLAGIELGCGLEFIAFADEENFSQDHVVYIRERGEQFGELIAAINLDGIANILGHNTITMMAHSAAFQAEVEAVTAQFPRVEWVESWPQSNHSTFAYNGVPAIALTSSLSWNAPSIYHQPADTPRWISPALLDEAVDLVAAIVKQIAGQGVEWARPTPETTPAA